MTYRVELSPGARRDLARLPPEVQGRISGALRKLSVSPQFAPAVIKLKGEPKGYRLRVGQYRVLYRIAERGRLVAVIRIGHRREVYR